MQRLGHCLASVWNPLAMRCPHLAHLGTGCAEASRLEVQLFRVFLQLAQPQPQPQPQPPAMSKNRKCIAGQTGRAQFAANVKLSCGSDARRWLSLVNHGTIKLRTTIHPLFTHYSLFSHYSATIQPCCKFHQMLLHTSVLFGCSSERSRNFLAKALKTKYPAACSEKDLSQLQRMRRHFSR